MLECLAGTGVLGAVVMAVTKEKLFLGPKASGSQPDLTGRGRWGLHPFSLSSHREVWLGFLLWEVPCLRIGREEKIEHGMFSERK